MTQTIEQLQARVAELDAENARLTTDATYYRNSYDSVCIGINREREQLLLAQAEIKRLRDAMQDAVDKLRNTDNWLWEDLAQALAHPSDTSALDAYVAEKVNEWRDAYERSAEAAILLSFKVAKLTRQRDLAVEAMREALECGEDGDWQSARRILASAIKESEVK